MRKRALSLLLAVLAALSLCAPVLAEDAEETPVPTPEETELPEETYVPTPEATEAPEQTVSPTAEPTEALEQTISPTTEPTEAPEQTVSPTAEPTEAPEETAVPTPEQTEIPEPSPGPSLTPNPNATPDPDAELMAAAATDVTLTINLPEVTLKTDRRSVTLEVTMDPYGYDWKKLEWTVSKENVIRLEDPSSPALGNPRGTAKIWAVGDGTATITVTAVDAVPPVSVSCQVTVTHEGSTWGKSLGDFSADQAVNMDIYDGRDLGIMSGVNLQIGGTCVAEEHISCMETALLKQGIFATAADVDMHERNVAYHVFNHTDDPLHNTAGDRRSNSAWGDSGLPSYTVAILMTQWNGPVHDDGYGHETDDGFAGHIAMPQDILFLPKADKETVKEMVVRYGAVGIEYQAPIEGWMYHKWHPRSAGSHGSAIVGWDDTVDPSAFTVLSGYESSMTVNSPGAWIVKNSWGTDRHGDGKGYFYLSYEASIRHAVIYSMLARGTYDFNYFYDGSVGWHNVNDLDTTQADTLAASFEAKKGGTDGQDEYLEAVNVGVNQGTTIQVDVYTDVDPDKLEGDAPDPAWGSRQPAAAASRTVSCAGFYTVKLAHPIKLEEGQYFTVAVTLSDGAKVYSEYERSANDLTFTERAGVWRNTNPYTLRIKAFTKLHTEGEVDPPAITPVPSPTAAPTASPSPSPSPSPDPTASPSPSPSPSPDPSPSPSPSPSASPAPPARPTPAPSPRPDPTASPTPSPSPSPDPTASPTPSPAVTPAQTGEPTAVPTTGPTTAPTATPEQTASHPVTSEPYYTPTPPAGAADATATPGTTDTPRPTDTAAPAATAAPAPVSPTNAPATPATGDGTPLALYAGLLALCAAGLVPACGRRRKRG